MLSFLMALLDMQAANVANAEQLHHEMRAPFRNRPSHRLNPRSQSLGKGKASSMRRSASVHAFFCQSDSGPDGLALSDQQCLQPGRGAPARRRHFAALPS